MAVSECIYSGGGGGYTNFSFFADLSPQKTHTISNKSGKKLLILIFDFGSAYTSSIAKARFDGATASGGTIENIGYFNTADGCVAGTWYMADVTSNTFTITQTYNSLMEVIELS